MFIPHTDEERKQMLKLMQGIHKFQDNLFSSQRELFERLAKGHTPDALRLA